MANVVNFLKQEGDKHTPLEEEDVLGMENGGHGATTPEGARDNLQLKNMAIRDMHVSTEEPTAADGAVGDFWIVLE